MNHNNKQPKLRFGGFDGDWVEGTFGEKVTEVKRPLHLQDNEQYQLVTVKRRNEGVVSRGFLYGKDILVKNYSQIRAGDYLISKRQIIHGANGLVPSELDGAIVSNEYFVAVSNEFVSTEFLALLSRTPEMYKKFLLSSYGVDIEKMVFNVEDWQKRSFSMPSEKAEQAAVGALFARLDKVIGGTQRKRLRLAAFKQAMLGKLFVRHGSRAPEMRLQGFGGEWVERKLGDLVAQIRSYPWSRDVESKAETGFRYIHYGDIHRGKLAIIENEQNLPSINAKAGNFEYLQKGDLIVADVSEDYIGIAQPCVINFDLQSQVVAGLHTIAIRPQEIDSLFLYYLLQTQSFKNYGKVVGTGTKVFGITAGRFLDFQPVMPSEKAEQAAIGAFFARLDRQLALYDAKLDKLGQVKAALLSAALV